MEQYVTLGLHGLSASIGIYLWRGRDIFLRRFGVTLFLYSAIGIFFYAPVLFFGVSGHELSRIRALWQAIVWAAYAVGLLSKGGE